MEKGDLFFGDENVSHSFPVNTIAAQQIAAFTGIPSVYYHRMREQNPALLDHNINAWFQDMDALRMVRTLDSRARAFLSDKYLPIDNFEIASRVLPIIDKVVHLNGDNVSCEVTERSMHIKVINYKMEGEVVTGDVVQSGIIVSNSEVGQGMVEVKPFVYRLVCKNGAVIDAAAKKRRHVGKTIDLTSDDYEIYRTETINAANQAFLMQIEDTVSSVVNPATFDKILDSMREAKDRTFTSRNIPAVVELAAKKYGVPEGETGNILTHLVNEGDTSLYGLANAFTRYSQDVDAYDYATALEEIGGKMFTMPKSVFDELNNATTTKEQRKRERKELKATQSGLLAVA
ncbi:MAG: DUF932 domain-containing protein [Planctomycetaceae bacterium]|nr:DUF932 domain-containing protein [Planctomycetaceae bacterium]